MGWSTLDMRMANPQLRYWYSKREINPSLMLRLFDLCCSQAEIDAHLRFCYVGVCVTGSPYYNVRHTRCYDVEQLARSIFYARSVDCDVDCI